MFMFSLFLGFGDFWGLFDRFKGVSGGFVVLVGYREVITLRDYVEQARARPRLRYPQH